MSTLKRKLPQNNLNRRVRVRREDNEQNEEPLASSSSEAPESGASSDEASDSEDDAQDQEEHGSSLGEGSQHTEESSEDESEPDEAGSISFGALAKAHASLQKSGKTKTSKSGKPANDDGWEDNEARERKAGKKDDRNFNRSNKHAPTEISSKKAVSRKREIIAVVKPQARDPRFDALSGTVDDSKVKRAYAFLDDYREDEMKALKVAIKKSKNEDEKETMKQTLRSMESRKKTEDRKKKQEEILAKHKKEEKELVKQGKKPFYLKEAEKKKRVLLETYSGLKKGELDHVIERRRRKMDQKEKKNLPWARRGADA